MKLLLLINFWFFSCLISSNSYAQQNYTREPTLSAFNLEPKDRTYYFNQVLLTFNKSIKEPSLRPQFLKLQDEFIAHMKLEDAVDYVLLIRNSLDERVYYKVSFLRREDKEILGLLLETNLKQGVSDLKVHSILGLKRGVVLMRNANTSVVNLKLVKSSDSNPGALDITYPVDYNEGRLDSKRLYLNNNGRVWFLVDANGKYVREAYASIWFQIFNGGVSEIKFY